MDEPERLDDLSVGSFQYFLLAVLEMFCSLQKIVYNAKSNWFLTAIILMIIIIIIIILIIILITIK